MYKIKLATKKVAAAKRNLNIAISELKSMVTNNKTDILKHFAILKKQNLERKQQFNKYLKK